jgi:hypothetical protein
VAAPLTLAIDFHTDDGYKGIVPTVKKFQYGTLAFSIDTYRLMYAGGSMLGEDYVKKPLYEVFDELAKDGWEPHVFFYEMIPQCGVMRRLMK